MITVECLTYFDITATGVTGHYKTHRDDLTAEEWNRLRNQQRNWETLTQLISLRTQISEITKPVNTAEKWQFEFTSEAQVWHDGEDPLGTLKSDAAGTPMLVDLGDTASVESYIITSGPKQNIWFTVKAINSV